MTRAGFVGLAGRPNVGKSTLVNAIVGAKVAIVSDRPQTTRRAIRGIATDPAAGWQMVLVDLPGVQRPRDALTERMQRRVEHELADADAALLVVDGEQGVGPGDRFIANALLGAGGRAPPVVCAVNKCDRLGPARPPAALAAAAELEAVDEVFPVSARTGAGSSRWSRGWPSCCPRGRCSTRPRSDPTCPATSTSPSWSASRCCAAPARRSRTRSRSWSTRSSGATTGWSRSTRRSGSRPSRRRES